MQIFFIRIIPLSIMDKNRKISAFPHKNQIENKTLQTQGGFIQNTSAFQLKRKCI